VVVLFFLGYQTRLGIAMLEGAGHHTGAKKEERYGGISRNGNKNVEVENVQERGK
jgi:hypothetical protein